MAIKSWSIWTHIASIILKFQHRWRLFSHDAVSKALSNQFLSCGPEFHIYRPYKISGFGKINVGSNVHINSYVVIQGAGGLKMGDNIHIGPNVTIYTSTHNYMGTALPYDHTIVKKPVVIEDNVWIGACVTILPGVVIEHGAIIGAGAVIVKNVPALAIVGGDINQRIIKYRDRDHYNILVENKKYGGVGGKLLE